MAVKSFLKNLKWYKLLLFLSLLQQDHHSQLLFLLSCFFGKVPFILVVSGILLWDFSDKGGSFTHCLLGKQLLLWSTISTKWFGRSLLKCLDSRIKAVAHPADLLMWGSTLAAWQLASDILHLIISNIHSLSFFFFQPPPHLLLRPDMNQTEKLLFSLTSCYLLSKCPLMALIKPFPPLERGILQFCTGKDAQAAVGLLFSGG